MLCVTVLKSLKLAWQPVQSLYPSALTKNGITFFLSARLIFSSTGFFAGSMPTFFTSASSVLACTGVPAGPAGGGGVFGGSGAAAALPVVAGGGAGGVASAVGAGGRSEER